MAICISLSVYVCMQGSPLPVYLPVEVVNPSFGIPLFAFAFALLWLVCLSICLPAYLPISLSACLANSTDASQTWGAGARGEHNEGGDQACKLAYRTAVASPKCLTEFAAAWRWTRFQSRTAPA